MASFAERVRLASRALVGVFTDDAAKQAFGLLQGIFPGAAGAPPQRGARERAAAYADMPWLHALADWTDQKHAAGQSTVLTCSAFPPSCDQRCTSSPERKDDYG